MCHRLVSIVFVALLLGPGFAQARIPDAVLGRWIVERIGSQPAYAPYKLRLYRDAASFPHDEKYGIARLELEASTREACFLEIDGARIVGPSEFQKRYPQVPYTLYTGTENRSALDHCAQESDDRDCVQHVIDDSAYLDKVLDAKALTWRKARGKRVIYSLDGDGKEIVLAPDPEWPR